jgi:ADP-heptose:LPS heptosyltransferase
MGYVYNADEFAELSIKSENISHKKFILSNWQCPGDLIMLSACIRDIKKWYPDIELDVDTSCNDIWINNPHITSLDEKSDGVSKLKMEYEIIQQSNDNIHAHFIHGFIDDFNRKTGYAVKLTEFKGDLHLDDNEKNTPVFDEQPEEFVVLIAGGKSDYESKIWWTDAWQQVVDECPEITFIQVGKTGRGSEAENFQSVIKADNCINKINKTSIRDLIRLIYQSVGTVSVVTAAMHISACFDKHAAVIAGGHEPWWWEKYPGHDYFHTIGRLDCCRFGGCWKGKCENKNDQDHQKCLELINPSDVADRIKNWF